MPYLITAFIAFMVYVAILAYFSGPLAGVVGVVGSLMGMGAALHEFASGYVHRVRNRGGDAQQPVPSEPAFRGYLYGPAVTDLLRSMTRTAAMLAEWMKLPTGIAERIFNGGLAVKAFLWPVAIAVVIGGVLGVASGFVVLAALSLALALVLLPVVGLALLFGHAMAALEGLLRRVRRAHYRCDSCHEAFAHPVYRCPGCGANHRRLLPGTLGVLRHRCACDEVTLPTLRLNGRAELPAECPNGHAVSGSLGTVRDLHLPLVGASSSGKTTFIAGAFAELSQLSGTGSANVVLHGADAQAVASMVDRLEQGVKPEKTRDPGNPALLTRLRVGRKQAFLFAYDLAGELYEDADRVRRAQALDHVRGAVLVVDPSSVPALARARQDDIAAVRTALQPAREEPSGVYARLVNSLRERGIHIDRLPLAVVVTKVDALGIEAELAELADERQADGERVRAWLERHGEAGLIARAEQDFKAVGWFAVSALGRTPDSSGAPFRPRGALAPLAWLLARNGFELPVAAAGANGSFALEIDEGVAHAEVRPGRARGARAVRKPQRDSLPGPNVKRLRVGLHVPWAVAVLALTLGVWQTDLFNLQPVDQAQMRQAGAPRMLRSHTTPWLSRGQLAAKRYRVRPGEEARLTVRRSRATGERPRVVVVRGHGSRRRAVTFKQRVARATLGPGRWRLEGVAAKRFKVSVRVMAGRAA